MMLGWFTKKHFLLDAMAGAPDIHCHVLPGIDDGAADVSTSLELLNRYAALGFEQVIATPHTLGDVYPNSKESITSAYSKLSDQQSIKKLTFASEYMIDERFEKLLEARDLLTMGDHYILIEMSYFQAPLNIEEVVYSITTAGYKPILAHPERYAYYHNDLGVLDRFKNLGCSLQLNALSLSSHYGKRVQRAAFALLEKHHYDFIGTDTHKMAHLEKLASLKVSKKHGKAVQRLSRNNQLVFS